MTFEELLAMLKDNGCQVWAEDDRIGQVSLTNDGVHIVVRHVPDGCDPYAQSNLELVWGKAKGVDLADATRLAVGQMLDMANQAVICAEQRLAADRAHLEEVRRIAGLVA